MNEDDAKYDETESVGGSMIRLKFREWNLAPEFEYLKDAPVGEFETCDTLWPIGLERKTIADASNQRFPTWTWEAVTALLEKHRQRATYTAVARVVGSNARTIMLTHPKTPRNSWVVAKRSGLPTGYRAAQIHPELKKRSRIILAADELRDWLTNPA